MRNMGYVFVFLVTLSCYVSLCFSSTIYFNETLDCTIEPCYYDDPSVWIGGVVPASIDDIIITNLYGSWENPHVIIVRSNATTGSITVDNSNINFTINANVTFATQSFTSNLWDHCQIAINGVFVGENITANGIDIYGTMNVSGLLEANWVFVVPHAVLATSLVDSYYFYVEGSLILHEPLVIFANSIYFQNQENITIAYASFGGLQVVNTTGYITSAFLKSKNTDIYSFFFELEATENSNFVINNINATITDKESYLVVHADMSNLELKGVGDSIYFAFVMNNSDIIVSPEPSVDQVLAFIGDEVDANRPSNLNFTTYDTVTLFNDKTLVLHKVIVFANKIEIGAFVPEVTIGVQSKLIITEELHLINSKLNYLADGLDIPNISMEGSTLNVTGGVVVAEGVAMGRSVIIGTLNISKSLSLFESANKVHGNLIQSPNVSWFVDLVDSKTILEVSNTANVGGELKLSNSAGLTEYLILTAYNEDGGVKGRFEKAFDSSHNSSVVVNVETTACQVYVVYPASSASPSRSPRPSCPKSNPTSPGFKGYIIGFSVIGVVLVLVLSVVAFAVYRRHQRNKTKEYEVLMQ